MININDNIKIYKNKLLDILNNEIKTHHSYEKWMYELSEFHTCLKKYVNEESGGGRYLAQN